MLQSLRRGGIMRRQTSLVALLVSIISTALIAQDQQEKIDRDVYWKIRSEAAERSQILQTLHMLTDVYGPRLTGSPNLKAASDWVVKRTTEWGLKNAHLEPWDFGRPGWANERTSAFIVAPVKDTLVVETLAWTPGTKGAVTASVVLIDPPTRVTREQLNAYLNDNRAKVKGRIVFMGQPARVPVTINPPAKRRDDDAARVQFDPNAPQAAGPGGPPPGPQGPADKALLSNNIVNEEINQFLISAGAVAKV